jgi:hypothetical protein
MSSDLFTSGQDSKLRDGIVTQLQVSFIMHQGICQRRSADKD